MLVILLIIILTIVFKKVIVPKYFPGLTGKPVLALVYIPLLLLFLGIELYSSKDFATGLVLKIDSLRDVSTYDFLLGGWTDIIKAGQDYGLLPTIEQSPEVANLFFQSQVASTLIAIAAILLIGFSAFSIWNTVKKEKFKQKWIKITYWGAGIMTIIAAVFFSKVCGDILTYVHFPSKSSPVVIGTIFVVAILVGYILYRKSLNSLYNEPESSLPQNSDTNDVRIKSTKKSWVVWLVAGFIALAVIFFIAKTVIRSQHIPEIEATEEYIGSDSENGHETALEEMPEDDYVEEVPEMVERFLEKNDGEHDFVCYSYQDIAKEKDDIFPGKMVRRELDNYGTTVDILLRKEQIGVKCILAKGDYGKDFYTCQNDLRSDDEMEVQLSFVDIDGDGTKEIIVLSGSILEIDENEAVIYKLQNSENEPFIEVGHFTFQKKVTLEDNLFTCPYGSQGLYDEYLFDSGKLMNILE